jgi:hypothetical protein
MASVKACDLHLKAESIEKFEGETEGRMLRRRSMLEQAKAISTSILEQSEYARTFTN